MLVNVGIFRIPKFTISTDVEIYDELMKEGITGVGASKILQFVNKMGKTVKCELLGSRILLKAFIEVNEKGTEAVAAVGATLQLSYWNMPHAIDFIADHPFLFVVKEDKSGIVLLIGKVLNPLAGSYY